MRSKQLLRILVFSLFIFIANYCVANVNLIESKNSYSIPSDNINLSIYQSPLNKLCFPRNKIKTHMLIDAHFHAKPFGGKAIPFAEELQYLKKSGVVFVTMMGIGQILPRTSKCTYYLDCPNIIIEPSIVNDIRNAEDYLASDHTGVYVILSMSFMNLAHPNLHDFAMLKNMSTLNHAYPGLFRWAGEVNVAKQALVKNGHKLIGLRSSLKDGHIPSSFMDKSVIRKWGPFMKELYKRDIPITLHLDIGNNKQPEEYLPVMEYILKLYPNNKIIWAHMGMSKELTNLSAKRHIAMMERFLNQDKNLYLDISWRVLQDIQFKKDMKAYTQFLDCYSTRIITGTDFVGSRNKNYLDYKEDLNVTSEILKGLNDDAYRNIALGENYIKLLHLPFNAPKVCQ